eukprot:756194_1
MCNSTCCKEHFPEWQKESTCRWLIVKFILLFIVAALYCAVSGVEKAGEWAGPRILEPEKALIVVAFMIIVGFLTILYTPWQHQIAPWWFKILAFILYFGTLIFFFWEFHIAKDGGLLPDDKRFNTNSRAFDLWTINHTFVGVLFGVMFPFVWMCIIVIAWELMELLVYGVGDEVNANAIIDVVVAIIGWWFVILIFSRKCIPWISARCAIQTKNRAKQNKIGMEDEYETYGT